MTIATLQDRVQETFNVQGFICHSPTDLSAAFPHGGTEIGLFGQMIFKVTPTRAEITAEEYANQTVEIIEGAENVVVAASLREFNATAIGLLFPGLASGGPSRTMTTQRGALGSARGKKILLSPLSSEDQPALLLYRAVPLVDEALSLSYHLDEEWGIGAVFLGLPDATGRLYAMNTLDKLAL